MDEHDGRCDESNRHDGRCDESNRHDGKCDESNRHDGRCDHANGEDLICDDANRHDRSCDDTNRHDGSCDDTNRHAGSCDDTNIHDRSCDDTNRHDGSCDDTNRHAGSCDDASEPNHDSISAEFWSLLIPEELLLAIFKEGVRQNGQVPYLCRTARVCRRWYELSYHPCLWTKVDLSIGWITRDTAGLRMLCETRLHKTTSLDLTAWFGMSDQCLECIVEFCDKLSTLSLAHCEKLTPNAIARLTDSTIPLQQLDLSFMSPMVSSHKCLRRLIQRAGSKLTRLNLSNNCIDDHFGAVLNDIMVHCSILTYLDLSHLNDKLMTLSMILVDLEALQKGCPCLEVILMTRSLIKARPATEQAKAFSPGFPRLRKFSAPSKVNDDFLQRVLKSSFNLENLKLKLEQTNEVHYTRPPITSLRKLVVHKAKLSHLSIRWHHSLRYLDLSWVMLAGTAQAMDATVRRIFDTNGPVFNVLDTILLCGCLVSANGIRPIFDCCPRLDHLNLNFCPMLPYGWSRDYAGAKLTIFKYVMVGLPNVQPVDARRDENDINREDGDHIR